MYLDELYLLHEDGWTSLTPCPLHGMQAGENHTISTASLPKAIKLRRSLTKAVSLIGWRRIAQLGDWPGLLVPRRRAKRRARRIPGPGGAPPQADLAPAGLPGILCIADRRGNGGACFRSCSLPFITLRLPIARPCSLGHTSTTPFCSVRLQRMDPDCQEAVVGAEQAPLRGA